MKTGCQSSGPGKSIPARTRSSSVIFFLAFLVTFLFPGLLGGPPAQCLCMAGTETADPKPQAPGQAAETKPTGDSVTVYVTSWCPACTMTINYLKKKEIPFTVKDIEKNKAYMDEMISKVGAYRGVPVLEINGKTHLGFHPSLIDDLGKK